METSRKVLICEDDENLRFFFREALKPLGFDVVEAEDGTRGLEILGNNKFDLVISDIHMYPMDGLTMLKNIRGMGNKVPFILATGNPDVESFIAGVHNLGAFEYLHKPVDIDLLYGVVNNVLSQGGR